MVPASHGTSIANCPLRSLGLSAACGAPSTSAFDPKQTLSCECYNPHGTLGLPSGPAITPGNISAGPQERNWGRVYSQLNA